MYTYEIMYKADPQKWNKDLIKSNYATFFQTAEYLAQGSRSGKRFPVFIYVADEKGCVCGQLGITVQKYLTPYSTPYLETFSKAVSKFGHRGTWVSGPIIHSNDKTARKEILKIIIKSLEEVAKQNNLIIIDGYSPPQDLRVDESYRNEFQKNNYQLKEFFTFVTELAKSEDELWNQIKESTRRDVSKAQKRNIVVKELQNLEDINDYLHLIKDWSGTKGIKIKIAENASQEYYEYYKSGVEKIFLAYEDSEPVSSHRLGCFNGIAYSHHIANSYSKPSSLGGPLLTWHAISWAKNASMRIYDFSGGEAPPSDKELDVKYKEQWSSLLAYKRKWGGNEFPYYHFMQIRKPVGYKLYRALSKIDWLYRDYKKNRYKRPRKKN